MSPPVGFPAFEAFFRATHAGREAFPWQRRLAAMVADGGWPDAIGVPTGMGKTACLDIAVWALARQAELTSAERSAATRVWYVVNRRLLVDAAFDHGGFLADVLARPLALRERWESASDADVEVVAVVGDALRGMAALGTERGPLHVVRLRGGAELGARPPDPSQPALIFATVAMFASRFLFRGYGSSALMRPVDAALAGTDALVLLDEAHLARPLTRVCQQAAACDLGDPRSALPGPRARPCIVALTATGDRAGSRFDLDAEDRRDPVIRRRLEAEKPTELVDTTRKDLVKTLAERAVALTGLRAGSTCVVFCNTAQTARAVKDRLDPLLGGQGGSRQAALLTGRMREREANQARLLVLDPHDGAPAGRDPDPARAESLFVVATQTLEVGADLDFDLLVTQSASVRSLVQRFGRLNRLGERPTARAVICHPAGPETGFPYGEEPSRVWEHLREAGADALDLAPGAIAEILGEAEDDCPRTGELLPDHLWELAKTSCSERFETPPEVFFEGLDDGDHRVSVCWRAYLPPDGERLLPAVHQDEAIEVPRHEVVEALKSRDHRLARRLAPDRASLETVDVDTLHVGDQVVLPADAGLYDQHGWNASSRETVLDVSLLRAGMLWLDEEAIRRIARADDAVLAKLRKLLPGLEQEDEPDQESEAEIAQAIVGHLRTLPPHPWMGGDEWHSYLDGFDTGKMLRAGSAPYLTRPRAKRRAPLVDVRADAFEELSFDASSTALAEHLGSVGETAAQVASAIGLPPELVRAVHHAGLHHDLGKNDPRFQRWLDPEGRAEEPLAKSGTPADLIEGTRVASGWPRGGRHELLSCRLLARWLSEHEPAGWDPELVLHLVASHHGHGRPLVPRVGDDAPPLVTALIEGAGVAVSGDLSAVDWSQPRRFRSLCERYGFWGLCLLEAILRQSDHAVSHAVEVT